ncbi:MAG: response regulator [bacterium]
MKKILIIEDTQEFSLMIQLHLEKAGYETELAFDGETGLKKALELKPDLIILDLKLPVLDGFKVCERLKASPEHKNIPIIMLTVRDSKFEKETGLALGASAYMTKPYDPKELIRTIKELVQ